ncbi:sensor histidine kinase [Vulgatibacter incomptus]|uniref:histidine kinase n=1 Tax=Vulgatibacter incomptus TaxID=1391653 RepID=A0A0K1PFQ9_9BACT|nr:HAMP domain-containing sensor histidine kinase [Vulgatibacter incomptus]AKU92342.1 sensor histidine kinase [Vulgatibacter incomptus]
MKGLLGMAAVLAFAAACWTGAFHLTTWAFDWIAADPAPLTRQLATAFTGLLLMMFPPMVVGVVHRPREIARWTAALNAIRRIGKGDFGVRIDLGGARNRHHPFVGLADGINDMAAELGRLEQMRQAFISDVSHELQSPLTSIGGFAKAVRDDELSPDDRRRYLDIIALESDRLSRLSDDLLRLTALEAEGPELRREPFRLDAQLQRVILAAEPQWVAKGLDVEAQLEPNFLVADEALLERVWTNLVHNAVKFTPAGGRVLVRSWTRDGEAVVEIVDTGIGIALEDQPRVFERFFKADPSRNRDAGGSGLGLALAEKVVSLHGGRIGVRSAPGEGATFTVTLASAQSV